MFSWRTRWNPILFSNPRQRWRCFGVEFREYNIQVGNVQTKWIHRQSVLVSAETSQQWLWIDWIKKICILQQHLNHKRYTYKYVALWTKLHFWLRFHIMVLEMPFFNSCQFTCFLFSFGFLFPFSIWILFPFSIWTFRSLF